MATINKKIEFRGMKSVPAVEEHINRQLTKIEHFLDSKRTPITINIVLEHHPDHAHESVSVRISVPIHAGTVDVVVYREGTDMYKLIDDATQRAYRDLLEAKEKLVDMQKLGK